MNRQRLGYTKVLVEYVANQVCLRHSLGEYVDDAVRRVIKTSEKTVEFAPSAKRRLEAQVMRYLGVEWGNLS